MKDIEKKLRQKAIKDKLLDIYYGSEYKIILGYHPENSGYFIYLLDKNENITTDKNGKFHFSSIELSFFSTKFFAYRYMKKLTKKYNMEKGDILAEII